MKKQLSKTEKEIYAYRNYVKMYFSGKKIKAVYWFLKYKYYSR